MANFNNFFQETNIKEIRTAHPKWAVTWIHYTKLLRSKYQYADPNTEEDIYSLADAIESEGQVLQNLIVRKMGTDQYEILAGHKRTYACKFLVEKKGLTKYEFLPCIVMEKNDVRAEFSVYSTNVHHKETPYQTMHRIERMKYLLENFPEEFPEVQGKGRMVEKLAQLLNKKRSMISDYQNIAHNLGDVAMSAFKEEKLSKSAATEIAGLPEEEQNTLLEQGMTSYTDIKDYKKRKDIDVSKKQSKTKTLKKRMLACVQGKECTKCGCIIPERFPLRASIHTELKVRYCPNCGNKINAIAEENIMEEWQWELYCK